MIKVTMANLSTNSVEITIEGHALEAPFGHDIVCAAVSTLFSQLQVSLVKQQTNDDGNAAKLQATLLDNGDFRMVNSFEIMIKQLAKQYPKNVSFEAVNANGGQG
ncbi:MAG TPA: ribosomal-processing cysteine protease Prp [Candidatus Levilactobacillus faecigallinarum]|uniref:Ribosomal processing cysteine protease Prp n=1 Tax=Candidatus Levilactobacillus faecigallinarum TaxID=2838638 RepID=A0A9D1QTP5_9LACO|nr:ribosomal-processing cysteine protease Prp [Candidatus Levilactobacillus faecigallinarum]